MVASQCYISRRGFTLIEILIVMALVALLLTIAVPRFFGSLEKSRETALREDLKVMRIALDKYYADKGHYPESLDKLVEDKYLRAVPIDPITESSGTWVTVTSTDEVINGISDVKSGAPGAANDGTPFGSF
ncbi:MAG: prepilin-type N-terminal cleavage/methylation domain-containing protein [Burkholderiales bacterium]